MPAGLGMLGTGAFGMDGRAVGTTSGGFGMDARAVASGAFGMDARAVGSGAFGMHAIVGHEGKGGESLAWAREGGGLANNLLGKKCRGSCASSVHSSVGARCTGVSGEATCVAG